MDRMRSYTDVSGRVEVVPVPVCQSLSLGQIIDFVYVRCNIPGPGTPRQQFSADFEGCSCDPDGSCDSTCTCISRFGQAYDERGHLVLVDPHSDKMKPIYECNKACLCAKTCTNRVVQRGVTSDLKVFNTSAKGRGLQTQKPIAQNAFVCEYAGEVISQEVSRNRTRNLKPGESNYILVLKEHTSSGEVRTHIDPTYIGNLGRFINHSCQPNLYMVPVRVNTDIPHAALFAISDIAAGEELTYDYSGIIQVPPSERSPTSSPDSKTNLQAKYQSQCQCGSQNCRGVLPFDTSLYESETDT